MFDFVSYVLARAVMSLCAFLPLGLALALGRALGSVAFRVVRMRRQVVLGNLRHVFGVTKTEAEIRAIAREAYRQFGMTLIEILRCAAAGYGRSGTRVELEAAERFREHHAAGRPIIICSPHLGNFDVGGYAFAALGFPLNVVMKPMRSERFSEFVRRSRESQGLAMLLSRAGLFHDLVDLLRAGGWLAVLPDQNAKRRGVTVDFLGKPASFYKGPALLHLATGAQIVVAGMERLRDPKSHLLHMSFLSSYTPTGDAEGDVRAVTQRIADVMAEGVRHHPEQYFWFHRLWGKRLEPAPEGVPAPARAPA